MSGNLQTDEIDIVELFQNLWDGKWLITGVSAAAVTLGAGLTLLTPNNFEAQMRLAPISSAALGYYTELNAFEFYTVTPETLIRSFVDVLDDRTVFIEEITRQELMSRDDYQSEGEYDEAVRNFAYEITLAPASNEETPTAAALSDHWILTIPGTVREETRDLLQAALNSAQEISRLQLIEQFNLQVEARRRQQEFALEDTRITISNGFEDYETDVADRLDFLSEQAQIARALNIASNTLEVNTFTQGSSILANVNAETPFYMRGYEAIEKEMDLLQSRSEPEAFIPNLREMERTIRSIEQDKEIDRVRTAFAASPISDPDKFMVARFDTAAMELNYSRNHGLVLALSLVLGVFVGSATVLIRQAMKSRAATTE